LGLRGVVDSPKLWGKYDNSENILFKAQDFSDPAASGLLRDLSSVGELSKLVERFRGVCKLPFEQVPDLDTFISGNFQYPRIPVSTAVPVVITPPVAVRSQYAVLDGRSLDILRRYIGQRVEVVGFVSHFHASATRHGRPYMFLNFGAYPTHTFTVVLWSSSLKAFQQSGVDPHTIVGKWIKVSGVIGIYRGRPQMEVETPSQIQPLSGEVQALQLIGGGLPTMVTSSSATRGQPIPESVFNTLYAGRPTTPAQVPAAGQPSSPLAQPRAASTKRSQNVLVGVLLAAILGGIGWAILGFWGAAIGVFVGYLVGRKSGR
jgi:hypothetical protein